MKKEKLEWIEKIHFKDEKQKAIFTACEELKDIPYSTLAGIANALNVWEWPDELPGRPEGWDEMSDDEKYDWINPILKMIKIIIGEKAIARYHATVENGMTDREFEDRWDSRLLKELDELKYYSRNADNKRTNGDSATEIFLLAFTCLLFGFLISALLL